MSLYNLIHGVNPLAGMLMAILKLREADVGRFRDCYLARDDKGELEIHVYTRNGGGNRSCWRDDENRDSAACDCTGCVMRFQIPKHELYLRDFDSDYDSTYATVAYRIPEAFKAPLTELVSKDEGAVPASPQERFQAFMDKMNQGVEDPDVARVMEAMKPLFAQISLATEEKP